MKRLIALAFMVAAPAGAGAATIANDFDAENGGVTQINYAGFADLTVTGAVDINHNGDFGIICAGGSGGCVDLAGSPGPGQISATLSASGAGLYAVTLSFDVSGNQRAPGTQDTFYFGISQGTSSGPSFGVPITIDWNAPFQTYGLIVDFVTVPGTWTAFVGTEATGNVGPVLDNFSFTVSDPQPIPAPAALALFGLGALAIGVRGRR